MPMLALSLTDRIHSFAYNPLEFSLATLTITRDTELPITFFKHLYISIHSVRTQTKCKLL